MKIIRPLVYVGLLFCFSLTAIAGKNPLELPENLAEYREKNLEDPVIFQEMLSKIQPDVILETINESQEVVDRMDAHSLVLRQYDFFKGNLDFVSMTNNNNNGPNTIRLDSFSPEVNRQILRVIYREKIQLVDNLNIAELYAAANFYGVVEAVPEISALLRTTGDFPRNISPKNYAALIYNTYELDSKDEVLDLLADIAAEDEKISKSILKHLKALEDQNRTKSKKSTGLSVYSQTKEFLKRSKGSILNRRFNLRAERNKIKADLKAQEEERRIAIKQKKISDKNDKEYQVWLDRKITKIYNRLIKESQEFSEGTMPTVFKWIVYRQMENRSPVIDIIRGLESILGSQFDVYGFNFRFGRLGTFLERFFITGEIKRSDSALVAYHYVDPTVSGRVMSFDISNSFKDAHGNQVDFNTEIYRNENLKSKIHQYYSNKNYSRYWGKNEILRDYGKPEWMPGLILVKPKPAAQSTSAK